MYVRYKCLILVAAVVLSVLSMFLLMKCVGQPEGQKEALSDAEVMQAWAADPDTLPVPDEVSFTGTGVSAGTQVMTFGPGASSSCSLGPVLNRNVALIAGHCFAEGEQLFTEELKHIGEVTTVLYGDGHDVAVVALDVVNRSDDIRVTPVAFDVPGAGDVVAKFGSTTLLTAGLVTDRDVSVVMSDRDVAAAKTTMCVRPGDSGAAVFDQSGAAWGLVSASHHLDPADMDSCDSGDNTSFIVPLKGSVEALINAGVDLGEPENIIG